MHRMVTGDQFPFQQRTVSPVKVGGSFVKPLLQTAFHMAPWEYLIVSPSVLSIPGWLGMNSSL
jgi:hypothetical protein